MNKENYELMLPVEGKSLVNLSNSVLKEMGAKTLNDTLEELDKIFLEKDYENIIVLLYDGLGTAILEKYLPKESFLRSNKVDNISSVFPATTVAATTSVLTGLYPCEHGWIGWNMFFKDDNETISVYTNEIKDTDNPSKHKVKQRKEMQYKTIIDIINEETKNKAYMAWPFDDEYPCKTLDEIENRVFNLCNKKGKKFIYGYYTNPDAILHEEGEGINIKNVVTEINNETQNLYNKLPSNSIIIVIADHGHIKCKYEVLSKNKELFDMLERTTTIEPRACGIKLKEEANKKEFEELFKKIYGEDFKLVPKEDVLKNNLFGKGKKHILLEDSIGDYIAIGIKDVCLNYDENGSIFKSNHAGITRDEMEIPLIVLKK